MKLKLHAPVHAVAPNGETLQVSACDIVHHVVTFGREFGQSGDLEKVRQGARLIAAFPVGAEQSGDIADEDLAALRAALLRPSRGWAALLIDVELHVPPTQDNPKGIVVRKRTFSPSALSLLPLIESLVGA
jgi:hypothetical protein